MSATERLDQWAAQHADEHPYCTDCPLTQAIAALRAVLARLLDVEVGDNPVGLANAIEYVIETSLGVEP